LIQVVPRGLTVTMRLAPTALRLALSLLCGLAPVACGDDAEPEDKPAKEKPEDKDEDGEALRAATLGRLRDSEFTPPDVLPTQAKRPGVSKKLRPLHELAGRAMALKAVYTWSTKTNAEVPSATVKAYVGRSSLERYLNPTELDILALERGAAIAGHAANARYRLENLWALAWVLGFDKEPPFTGGRVSSELETALLGTFVAEWDGNLKAYVGQLSPRSDKEVAALEDVFYCAHAVARAMAGGKRKSAPETFDIDIDGGTIHERRHSLSWALSPGTPWDQTDLTT